MPLSEVSGQDYGKLTNCMWNVVITMNQVGYGDMYPKSNMGRAVAALICFWGFLFMSTFFVSVTNVLTFTDSELKSYKLILKLKYRNKVERNAVGFIS